MTYNKKHLIFLFFTLQILRGYITNAQSPLPVKIFTKDSLEKAVFDTIFNKTIPEKFALQIKTALQYYPTLKHTSIVFNYKKTHTPLAAAPTFWSVFRKKSKRTYIITISSESTDFLNKIILDSLNFNAQIGVLGHEISHILEFDSKNGLFFIGLVLRYTSKKAIDRFEYNTDKRCIEQGLGYQLLAWSEDVRTKLKVTSFNRSNSNNMMQRERYMHPMTIKKYMAEMAIYTTF
jgi:hypothetical protein